MDDATLIRGTLTGRLEDFETLVERYQKMLYAFVHHELADADAADDVVQATFVSAWTHLATFRFESSFKTWLHEIARNECRTRFRRRRAEISLDEAAQSSLPADAGDPNERRLRAELAREVAKLPPRQRSVLSLRIFSDLPFREIARIEGVSINAAKVSFHLAVKRLKGWLT